MLEAGFCRSRETVNVLMECVVDTCLCGLLFFAFGFAFMFSHGNAFIGYHWFFLKDVPATYESTGVAFLAESGILDGRVATTHWGVAEIFRKRYPQVRWQTDQFVTEDGNLFCSGGVYASIDLSLYLVEKFCGHEIALQVAKSLLLSMPRGRQSGYSVVQLSRPHSDAKIRQAEEYLQQHFDSDVSIDSLAERAGMGPRNFIRRFKAATGRLPGAYVQTLRVSAARELLEHGASSIQTVSSKIGYEDIGFFRNLFKRHTGMTPAEYRNRFAQMSFDRGELAAGTPAVSA
jgi:transcriptional regulator GlxA family with amidase domain